MLAPWSAPVKGVSTSTVGWTETGFSPFKELDIEPTVRCGRFYRTLVQFRIKWDWTNDEGT